jgi:predicted nucleic acid-binding protein
MAEILVCDTSLVGHLSRLSSDSSIYESWGAPMLRRLQTSILAISVVTVAESRAGFLIDRWGPRRIRIANRRLAGFLQFPLERRDLDEWARLRAAARRQGVALSDNDLWIAATASARELVLVTCDRDHVHIAPELGTEVLFLQPPV